MDPRNCITKPERTFEEWRLLKRNKGRQSVTQQENETEFACKLDDLFDIPHLRALEMITIPEDREFLSAQKRRGGSLAGVDAKLAAKEKRSAERQERRRMEDLKRNGKEIAKLISSSSRTDTEEEDARRCKGVTRERAVGSSLSQTTSKNKYYYNYINNYIYNVFISKI